jgi:hypothetical protein
VDRLTSNSLLSHHGVGLFMTATLSTPTKAIPISGSHSVDDLLAALRHCSELELSDEEKCHLPRCCEGS